jgi:hypothetical protein
MQERRHVVVDATMNFEYYYGIEADQFTFYRIPRLLIKDKRFKGVSNAAKLLYGLLLDRMSLSIKNGWLDEENRAYIIYTIDAIMEDLGCCKSTCVKIMKELDTENGIGLIEKKRQGLGKPDLIYVKNFTTIKAAKPEESPDTTDETLEVQNTDFQKSKIYTSRSAENELQEVLNSAPNYTNYNQTNNSQTDINHINSIHPPANEKDGMDVMENVNAYIKLIKENIDYEYHMAHDKRQDKALYDELFEVICEIVCVQRVTVRIAGEEYPYELVKSKFLKLNGSHLEYVMDCMKDITTKITNIKAYMITALYNAPTTINHYHKQEVQRELYGGSG